MNEKLKKYCLKRVLPFTVAGAILISTVGCSGDKVSKDDYDRLQKSITELEKNNAELQAENKELTEENERLEDEMFDAKRDAWLLSEKLEDLYGVINEDEDVPEVTAGAHELEPISTISQEEAKKLFYKDGKPIVENPFGKPLILTDNDKNINSVAREIIHNGAKYLVDISDFTIVYANNYESTGFPVYYRYLDSKFGGHSTGEYAGFVIPIRKNGHRYLLDATNLANVLVSDLEDTSNPFYLYFYDASHGGKDVGLGRGYVKEITRSGVNYLVDANDYTHILLSGYKKFEIVGNIIKVTYDNDEVKAFYIEDLTYKESDVLKRTLATFYGENVKVAYSNDEANVYDENKLTYEESEALKRTLTK